MIARGHRFPDDGAAFGLQSRQQDSALYLGAWDRRLIPDAMERRGSMNDERRKAILRSDDRAHLLQRVNHASHGSLSEGRISRDSRTEWLRRKHTGQQPHRGSGILRVKRV